MFGGPTAVAAFTAARTLTNPAISMVTAVDSLDKPRGARGLAKDGLPGLRKSVSQTRRLLAIITGGPLCGPPTNKDQCKNGGWANFNFPRSFEDQGDCVSGINTGK